MTAPLGQLTASNSRGTGSVRVRVRSGRLLFTHAHKTSTCWARLCVAEVVDYGDPQKWGDEKASARLMRC